MYWLGDLNSSLLSSPSALFKLWTYDFFPVIALTIEWFFNRHYFNLGFSFFYIVAAYAAYLPLALFSKEFLGYYTFMDFANWESWAWTFGSFTGFLSVVYWVVGIITNVVHSGWTVPNPLAQELVDALGF